MINCDKEEKESIDSELKIELDDTHELQRKEIAQLKTALANAEELNLKSKKDFHDSLQHNEVKAAATLEEFKKKFIKANTDKEAMVMKFAVSEKEAIIQRNAKLAAEKALQLSMKEKEDLQAKINFIILEKNRMQQLADTRSTELNNARRDAERCREQLKLQESKTVSALDRLKTDAETHRLTQEHLEITLKELSETRSQIEISRQECSNVIRRYTDENELKERKKNMTEKENSVKLMIDEAASHQLDDFKSKLEAVTSSKLNLERKLKLLEAEKTEKSISHERDAALIVSLKCQRDDLLNQVAEIENLRIRVNRREAEIGEKVKLIDTLDVQCQNLKDELVVCHLKEADLLQFTEKLTDTNVIVQSELDSVGSRKEFLEIENARLLVKVDELEKDLSKTQEELNLERTKRLNETEILAKKLAENVKAIQIYSQKSTDLENELRVVKRRNTSSLRELTRELQSCRRQIKIENGGFDSTVSINLPLKGSPVGDLSRASSNSSLVVPSTTDYSEEMVSISNGGTNLCAHHDHAVKIFDSSSYFDSSAVSDSAIKLLMDKIIQVQTSMAKKQDKIDFLDEHISTLLLEIQKKNKIIQFYVLRQETGTLTNRASDEYKRRTSEHSSIMSSLFTSKQNDSCLTLELSLEINKKLQAVLEDTLLKNITLKENIRTLGSEIEKYKCT